MSFKDQVVIVTGSSSGIGEAVARRFAKQGAKVVINSRTQERADRVAKEIEAQGGTAVAIAADVANRDDVFRMVRQAVDAWGRLDVMVNNAGISAIMPAEDLTEEDWRRPIDVLLTGVFWGSQAAAKQMIAQGHGGAIIQISSVYGLVGNRSRVPYITAKHGLEGMTRALAIDWAPYGIRVISVAPGYIETPLDVSDQETTGDYTPGDVKRQTPLHRYGTVEECADVVLFAASDNASYVTGSTIIVDGGWVANGGWARQAVSD